MDKILDVRVDVDMYDREDYHAAGYARRPVTPS